MPVCCPGSGAWLRMSWGPVRAFPGQGLPEERALGTRPRPARKGEPEPGSPGGLLGLGAASLCAQTTSWLLSPAVSPDSLPWSFQNLPHFSASPHPGPSACSPPTVSSGGSGWGACGRPSSAPACCLTLAVTSLALPPSSNSHPDSHTALAFKSVQCQVRLFDGFFKAEVSH